MDVPTMLLTLRKIIWGRKFTGWVRSPKLECQNNLIYFSPKILALAPKLRVPKVVSTLMSGALFAHFPIVDYVTQL